MSSETKTGERPILFSGPMVRAILREVDPKTQTRRVVKGTALQMLTDGFTAGYVADPGNAAWCPYGKAGDSLWVRETFALQSNVEDDLPPFAGGRPVKHFDGEDESGWLQPHYRATDPMPELGCPEDERHNCGSEDICASPWKPSIFMPRWASRITLEVTEVRVQRVQKISEEDAKAEGISEPSPVHGKWCDPAKGREGHWSYRQPFSEIWNSINAKRGFGWDANPWVWCVTFRRSGLPQ